MKKSLFLMTVLSVALVACTKEADFSAENAAPAKYTLRARLSEQLTKTFYEETTTGATFSWIGGDQFKAVVYEAVNGTTNLNFYRFIADQDGADVEFSCASVNPDWVSYPRTGYAVYPLLTLEGTKEDPRVVLPAEYSVSGTDLTRVGVPLIGKEDTNGDFDFRTAVGVLGITLTNTPVEARKVVIKGAADDVLSGTFNMDYENGYSVVKSGTSGNTLTINFSQQPSGATVKVYAPLPIGQLSAGTVIEVQKTDGTVIKATPAFKRALTVKRNVLTEIPAISVEDWVSLGTGKFIDNHCFYVAQYWNNASTIDCDNQYLDVEIQQHATETTHYRLVHPYAALYNTYGATKLASATGPYDYLTFTLIDGGKVIFDHYRTGLDHYGYGKELWYDAPYWGYAYIYQNSRIIKYAIDGISPANIQLAPYLMGALDEDASQNPKIEIVFPGSTPMLGGYFNYAGNSSAAYSEGDVTATVGANATAVKVAVAASLDDAIAILEAGTSTDILTFTTSGNQALALSAGNYHLAYKVETDGHGYTFKDGGSFQVLPAGQIALTESMVTAVGTCTWGDDNGGIPALIDGNPSTYWHSDWYYGITGNDSVYGLFFTITLNSPIQKFHYKFTTRSTNSNASPTHVVYGVSSDGTNWTKLDEEDTGVTTATGGGVTVTLKSLDAGTPVKYLRFGVTESTDAVNYPSDDFCGDLSADGYKKSFNLAELELYSE